MRTLKHLLLALVFCAAASAQVAERANQRYHTAEGRAALARVLDGPDRDERQRPHELIEALAIQPSMTVVDLGTGVGYMLPFLSRAVGPQGRVVAQDIYADFLEKARQKAENEELANVTVLLGTEKNPNLPENSADLILTLDAYHHFDYPEPMLAGIRKALRKGGRFVVVDFYKEGFGDPDHIRLEEPEVIREIEANGFRLVSRRVHIPGRQYILVLMRDGDADVAAGAGEATDEDSANAR